MIEYPSRFLFELILYCEEHNIDIKVLSEFATLLPSSVDLVDFDGLPFQVHRQLPEFDGEMIIKRVFDFVVSLFLLVLCFPLFCLI